MSRLGEYITKQREGKNLSQKELAKRAGISQATIQKIEVGLTKSPKIDILVAIAKALKVSVISLVLAYQGKSESSWQGIDKDLLRKELHESIDEILERRLSSI